MARNKISDLNNHLFAQLERLSNEDLSQEELKAEIARSKSISDISKNIIEANKVTLDAMKLIDSSEIMFNEDMDSNIKRLTE